MFTFRHLQIIQRLNLRRYIHNEFITTNERNGVREIILNHSKTRNSLSKEMMSSLIAALNKNKDDEKLRAIVLTAAGPVFSAGHNLKQLSTEVSNVEEHRNIFRIASELMLSIIESPVPVIAKVDGLAAAAGCQLVATCDIVVCSETSKFATPGANFGVFCSTPGIAVGRCVPKSTAMYMLLTGDFVSAQEAYNAGLVTKVAKQEQLENEVDAIIEKIKMKSRSIVSLGKEFYYKQINLNIKDAYKLGEDIMVKNINMSDGQEGIKSFAKKKKPIWSHKTN